MKMRGVDAGMSPIIEVRGMDVFGLLSLGTDGAVLVQHKACLCKVRTN